MGIEYKFSLTSDTPVKELFRRVSLEFGGQVVKENVLLDVNGHRLAFLAGDADDRRFALEDFGFPITRKIYFRVLNPSDPQSENTCIRMVDFLLRIEPGNAVFQLHEGSSGVALLRRSGKVVVYNAEDDENPEAGFFNAEGRTHLSVPFEVRSRFTPEEAAPRRALT